MFIIDEIVSIYFSRGSFVDPRTQAAWAHGSHNKPTSMLEFVRCFQGAAKILVVDSKLYPNPTNHCELILVGMRTQEKEMMK
jgi:hypothetical protein